MSIRNNLNNADGERIIKIHRGRLYQRRTAGNHVHENGNYMLYPASIISINKNRFAKHYFIGDKRIASKIGTVHLLDRPCSGTRQLDQVSPSKKSSFLYI